MMKLKKYELILILFEIALWLDDFHELILGHLRWEGILYLCGQTECDTIKLTCKNIEKWIFGKINSHYEEFKTAPACSTVVV